MERKELEGLSREVLVSRAEALGIVRPRALTIPELIDEIMTASERKAGTRRSRGWFGRARDLLTSVIDRGLHLPDATRGRTTDRPPPMPPSPLPTVTLAEIYAAQGHFERAVATLEDVLVREPDHAEAKRLAARFSEQLRKTRPSTPPAPANVSPSEPPSSRPAAPRAATGAAPAAQSTATGARTKESPAAAAPVAAASPAAAATPIAELADRYEVDEVVAIAVDPHTVYLYWEARPQTLAAARAKNEHGSVTVRVACVTPALPGPRTDVRDIGVDALFGELFVQGVPENTQVRVTIGWKSAHGFEPFAVGMDLVTPRASVAPAVTQRVARWSDVGGAPLPSSDTPLTPPFRRPGASLASPRMLDEAGGGDFDTAARAGLLPRAGERAGELWVRAPGGTTKRVTWTRPVGSSELFRRESAWSLTARAPSSFSGRAQPG